MAAVIDQEKCEGCAKCVDECPTSAISIQADGKAIVDPDACADCGGCVEVCPTEAISMD